MTNFRQLAKKVALFLSGKKAEKVIILDVRKLTFFTDYFLLANATSLLHLKTLRETIAENLTEEDNSPLHQDGNLSSSWQVLDYGGLIIHFFLPEIRSFYNLEKIWQGAKMVRFTHHLEKNRKEVAWETPKRKKGTQKRKESAKNAKKK